VGHIYFDNLFARDNKVGVDFVDKDSNNSRFVDCLPNKKLRVPIKMAVNGTFLLKLSCLLRLDRFKMAMGEFVYYCGMSCAKKIIRMGHELLCLFD
jgi:hypothetical protein